MLKTFSSPEENVAYLRWHRCFLEKVRHFLKYKLVPKVRTVHRALQKDLLLELVEFRLGAWVLTTLEQQLSV